jgi:hypothetical protein
VISSSSPQLARQLLSTSKPLCLCGFPSDLCTNFIYLNQSSIVSHLMDKQEFAQENHLCVETCLNKSIHNGQTTRWPVSRRLARSGMLLTECPEAIPIGSIFDYLFARPPVCQFIGPIKDRKSAAVGVLFTLILRVIGS